MAALSTPTPPWCCAHRAGVPQALSTPPRATTASPRGRSWARGPGWPPAARRASVLAAGKHLRGILWQRPGDAPGGQSQAASPEAAKNPVGGDRSYGVGKPWGCTAALPLRPGVLAVGTWCWHQVTLAACPGAVGHPGLTHMQQPGCWVRGGHPHPSAPPTPSPGRGEPRAGAWCAGDPQPGKDRAGGSELPRDHLYPHHLPLHDPHRPPQYPPTPPSLVPHP